MARQQYVYAVIGVGGLRGKGRLVNAIASRPYSFLQQALYSIDLVFILHL